MSEARTLSSESISVSVQQGYEENSINSVSWTHIINIADNYCWSEIFKYNHLKSKLKTDCSKQNKTSYLEMPIHLMPFRGMMLLNTLMATSLVSYLNVTSAIWAYFGFELNENGQLC